MKITVYTITFDDDFGTRTQAFSSEAERDDALYLWGEEKAPEELVASYEQGDIDLHEFAQQGSGYLDTFQTDEIVLDVSLRNILCGTWTEWRWARRVRRAWRRGQA